MRKEQERGRRGERDIPFVRQGELRTQLFNGRGHLADSYTTAFSGSLGKVSRLPVI